MMIRGGIRKAKISHLLFERTATGGEPRRFLASSRLSTLRHSYMLTENARNVYPLSSILLSDNMTVMYSSKPSFDDDIKPLPVGSSLSDKDYGGIPREEEPISIFFQKRKEALDKEKQQQIHKRKIIRGDNNKSSKHASTPARSQQNENLQSSGFHHQQNQQQNYIRQQHDRKQQGNKYGKNNNNDNFRRNNNNNNLSNFHNRNNSMNNNNIYNDNNNDNKNNNNRRGRPEGLSDVLHGVSRNQTKNQQQSSQQFQQKHNNNHYQNRGSRFNNTNRDDNSRSDNNNNNNHYQNRGSRFNNTNRDGNSRNDTNNNNNHYQTRGSRFNNTIRDVNSRNDTNNNNNNNKNEVTGTTRLADMMKKLRNDSPSKFQEGRLESSLSARFTRNKDSQASWRQKRFQIPSGDSQEGHRGNWQRQSGRGSRPPQADEFLHGRIARTDDEVVDNIKAKTDMTNNNRVVILPINNSLTLMEASTLFRTKVDVIRKKLRAMGERIEGDIFHDAKTSSSPIITTLDIDMLELLAMDLGIETVRSTKEPVIVDSEKLLMQQRRSDIDIDIAEGTNTIVETYPARPPIVTIMGHVDHGKTTLMDALRRKSREQQRQSKKEKGSKKRKKKNSSKNLVGTTKNIAGTEAGGITQIISAFQVGLDGHDEKITLLDTPGHAAFRAMRQSGSHAADIIVLVIAADDGISEQTKEIINFYKSIVKGSSDSGISMVVAVNKIDKPGIDAKEAQMRIENQLLEHGIISEGMSSDGSEFGQPVQVIPTSGLSGEGLDNLMEGLLLQSEMMDLRADDQAYGEGIVMDARQEKGLGVVADCIVRWGKIEIGDVIISGDQVSQVRMLKDVNNKMLKKGLPSQPVRIIGFKSLPKAGDPLMVVKSEKIAKDMLEQRRAIDPSSSDRPDGVSSDLELHITGMRRRDTWRVNKFTNKAAKYIDKADGSVRIPIIIKADADGSLAAVRESLLNIGDDSKHTVVIDPIMEGIGEVTPSDIQMAKESEATIFSFGSKRTDKLLLNLAESEGVSICSDNVIYSLLDEAKNILGYYLPLVPKEHTHGRALVKAVFSIDTINGVDKVAGLNVMNGCIYKSKAPGGDSSTNDLDCHFRVYRDGELISPEGENVTASSLRRFKEIVESVRLGDECGLALSGFTDLEEGDEIECYSVEMKKAKL